MGDLAVDTEVHGSNGRYRAMLSRDWEIWGPNGGYLAALALRAFGRTTQFPRPASFLCHYLNVARFEAVDIEVEVLRTSRRAESLRLSMRQNDRRILEAMLWTVAEQDGLEHETAACPIVARPEALAPMETLMPGAEMHPFWRNIECRPTDWTPPADRGPGVPSLLSWYRFRPTPVFDDPFLEAARTAVLADTLMWPAAWRGHARDTPYIAPNLDLAVQFHRAPSSEWLLCDIEAPIAADGLIGGGARVRDADGRLLATGTAQLLCRRTQ